MSCLGTPTSSTTASGHSSVSAGSDLAPSPVLVVTSRVTRRGSLDSRLGRLRRSVTSGLRSSITKNVRCSLARDTEKDVESPCEEVVVKEFFASELASLSLSSSSPSLSCDVSDESVGGVITPTDIPTFREGDLTVGRLLGRGSFSDVFEVYIVGLKASTRPSRRQSCCEGVNLGGAHRPQGVAPLAMKRLRPPSSRDDNEKAYKAAVADLARESAILASLDHPNIIKIRGCDSCDVPSHHPPFILLDRLRDTLADRIGGWRRAAKAGGNKHSKRAPYAKQIEVACCVADALRYLHSRGIAFRDLKPANVGFDGGGTLKLFDFGFAAQVPQGGADSEETSHGPLTDVCGTVRYMAPEVGMSAGHGLLADVYSFGLLLWEVCALKTPFESLSSAGREKFAMKVWVKGHRPSLRGISDSWPTILRELMSACWAGHPGERPSIACAYSMLRSTLCNLALSSSDECDAKQGSGAPALIKRVQMRSLSLPN